MVGEFGHASGRIDPRLITIFTGTLGNIPSGWVLCDGNNGTPDLTDRFVRGFDAASNIGNAGGEASKTLSKGQLASHVHGGSTDQQGSHTHDFDTSHIGSNLNFNDEAIHDTDSNSTWSTESAGSHSHTGHVNDAGGNASIENRPPYYEVAFLMKI